MSTTPTTPPSTAATLPALQTTPVAYKDSSTAGTDLEHIGDRLQVEMENCWHFLPTYEDFAKIRDLNKYYPSEDGVKTELEKIAEGLKKQNLTGKEHGTYAPLVSVI